VTSLALTAPGVSVANPGVFVPPSVVKEREIRGGGRPYESFTVASALTAILILAAE
jgi:hypothetical protein